MKLILFFVVMLSCFKVNAQKTPHHNYYWDGIDTYATIIGVTNCYVRNKPTLSSLIIDSLQVGKELKVKKYVGDNLKIKGINVSWVEIEYENKKGILKNGFIWKGFLAVGYNKKAMLTFLCNIEKIDNIVKNQVEIEMYTLTVKILDSNKSVISTKSIEKDIANSAFFEGKNIGTMGLKNVKDIYRISFSGEACGIPSLFYYFVWDEKKLEMLFEKYAVSDAGAYYHVENFVFPNEKGGRPNTIIKNIEEAVNEDENLNQMNVSSYNEIYKWNGAKLVFLNKEKTKKLKLKK